MCCMCFYDKTPKKEAVTRMQLQYFKYLKQRFRQRYGIVIDYVLVGSEGEKSLATVLASGLPQEYYYDWPQDPRMSMLTCIQQKYNFAWSTALAQYRDTDMLITTGSSDFIPYDCICRMAEHECDNVSKAPRLYGISHMSKPGAFTIEVNDSWNHCYMLSNISKFQGPGPFMGGFFAFNRKTLQDLGWSLVFGPKADENRLISAVQRVVTSLECVVCGHWFLNYKVRGCDYTTFEWIANEFPLLHCPVDSLPELNRFVHLLTSLSDQACDLDAKLKIPFVDLKSQMQRHRALVEPRLMRTLFETTDYVLGDEVKAFEDNFASYIGTKHCVSVGNGTDAIEIALNALSIPKGSTVVTQANTYAGTVFAIENTGCDVELVDVDLGTLQIDLDQLEARLTSDIRAIVVVHMFGSCCDMDRLMMIARAHNLRIIEDCAQAHGATYKGKRLGTFGDISTFSFYPTKNLGAAGDGGAICCQDDVIAEMARLRRNQGVQNKYDHVTIGRNSRLDTVQAIVLNSKLTELDHSNESRRRSAALYNYLLADCPKITVTGVEADCTPAYHLYVVRTEDRDGLKRHLEAHDVGTGIHYPSPIHKLPACSHIGRGQTFPTSEAASNSLLSLPMYADMPEEFICRVVRLMKNYHLGEQ